MKARMMILVLAVMSLLIMGCTQTVSEITKDDSYLDESVTVKGTAKMPIKIGDISGYTLVDKNEDSIIIADDELPDEGDKVVARGTLKKGILGIGYYIESN